jgi:hypothetical protein
MGAEPAEPIPPTPEGLTLTLGLESIRITILSADALLEGGKIIERVLSLASLKDKANRLYFAAPRLLGTTIEAGIFRSSGIGLLLFDDRKIEEVVPAHPFKPIESEPQHESREQVLMAEIEALKTMYAEMDRNVTSLRSEIKSHYENPHPQEQFAVPQERSYIPQTSDLPPFFNNNPWLDVLAKRGREAIGSVAG